MIILDLNHLQILLEVRLTSNLSFLEKEAEENAEVLDEIVTACKQLTETRETIAFLQAQLETQKKIEEELSSETIPNLLLAQGLLSIELDTGDKVRIDEKLYASVPKDPKNKRIVVNWLIKQNGQYLIKREVSIEEPEKWILDLLNEKDVPHAERHTINTNSFKAFIRAKLGLKKGSLQEIELSDIPREANTFIRKETIIKR